MGIQDHSYTGVRLWKSVIGQVCSCTNAGLSPQQLKTAIQICFSAELVESKASSTVPCSMLRACSTALPVPAYARSKNACPRSVRQRVGLVAFLTALRRGL